MEEDKGVKEMGEASPQVEKKEKSQKRKRGREEETKKQKKVSGDNFLVSMILNYFFVLE
jgi:hypothetical protein